MKGDHLLIVKTTAYGRATLGARTKIGPEIEEIPLRNKSAFSQVDSAMNGEKCKVRMQTKRATILAKAIETFAKDGFQNADVQMIAENAGVGYGTVYRYFRTKEELFWSATHVVLERLYDLGVGKTNSRCLPGGHQAGCSQ
jgi:hypothetical protein